MGVMSIPEPERVELPPWYLSSRMLDRVSVAGGTIACVVQVVVLIWTGAGPAGYGALALLIAGFALSRWFGVWGLIPAVLGAVLGITLSDGYTAGWIVVLSIIFSAGLRGPAVFIGGTLAGLALYFATVGAEASGFDDPLAYVALSTTVAAAATGYAIRAHEIYLLTLHQRAQDVISSRDLEVTRRVAEERLRIAQDLHDVVGHEIAVIGTNLGVIDVQLPPGASTERAALANAQSGVRRVLQETQRILGVLRRGDKTSGNTLMLPTIERIPELVENLEASGGEVRLIMPDGEMSIDPSVSVAAFRITQEALTNAHRHGSGPVDVGIHVSGMKLIIDVENSVAADSRRAVGGRGYGLIGMRERVEAAGGLLDIHSDDEIFRVTATLRTDGGSVR